MAKGKQKFVIDDYMPDIEKNGVREAKNIRVEFASSGYCATHALRV